MKNIKREEIIRIGDSKVLGKASEFFSTQKEDLTMIADLRHTELH